MAERPSGVKASVGFASETGPRERNEDFAGAVFGWELPQPRRDVVAAIADGIGGAKGGRVAAETAVRGFLDGFCDLPETMEARRAAAQVIDALNSWIHSQGRRDAELAGLGCTFTAPVLRGRSAHVLHVGDTRAYRLGGERLACLTTDHVREGGGGRSNVLTRALGVETEVRLDHALQPVGRHDHFLLCSDGVHRYLRFDAIADILRERSASQDCARAGRRRTAGGQRRQLHRAGHRRRRSADRRIGRHRRRRHATAADLDADRGRDGRRFRAQGAAVRRAIRPPVRRRR
jgi:serine/threonine protein phosphatase PrpC